jgi:hypothetical protein
MAETRIRNIDFDALNNLRDKHGAIFPRGQLVFRQGDTSSELYVVLQGAVELSITDPKTGAKKVVFNAPKGDFFGEMSCFAAQPRSATATVLEDDTVLLRFTQQSTIQLLRTSPRFALGVIQRLCDRVVSANEQIERLVAVVGSDQAAEAAPVVVPVPTATGPAPKATNESQFGQITRVCPISGTSFTTFSVKAAAVQVVGSDSDLRELHAGPNPMHYAVHVCPVCGYAAYSADFDSVTAAEASLINKRAGDRKSVLGGRTLQGERTPQDAALAYRLALACYADRPLDQLRAAGLHHRLAWCYRETGDNDAERKALADALRAYAAAAEQPKDATPVAAATRLYTTAELWLRLGSGKQASAWFALASVHPGMHGVPDLQRLCRERWVDARAEREHA